MPVCCTTDNVQLLDDYLASMVKERKKSPATLRAYGADLRGFSAWLDANQTPLTSVRRTQLRRFLVELEEQGLAATSVQRKLASLRGLFAWLLQEGHVLKDPAKLIKGPKAPKRVPTFLTTPEVDKLLAQPFGDSHQGLGAGAGEGEGLHGCSWVACGRGGGVSRVRSLRRAAGCSTYVVALLCLLWERARACE